MAFRKSDAAKWTTDAEFRSYSVPMKLFWLYLLDNCNIAGIWVCDRDLSSIQIERALGIPCDPTGLLNGFGDRIRIVGNDLVSDKWWIPYSIALNCGRLGGGNYHATVKKILQKEIDKETSRPLYSLYLEQYQDKLLAPWEGSIVAPSVGAGAGADEAPIRSIRVQEDKKTKIQGAEKLKIMRKGGSG